ncbi:UDP-glycosyltransferase 73C3-like [Juglans microcarpa x Juglans regia]|uniref:UDP-glycosyltransferase 73C3-like n=1 Tax=Juglans microcarpa x Juglans regia TaxID=2249226 RepID=UPI001B7E06EB|nr:UDP-glycosyltransferase 73C3-like [Juglans microcarpa x Juglans regia]
MGSQLPQLHLLLLPLMSQSHLIPFADMAKLLAHRGVKVTLILTPQNAARFNKILDHANASNLNLEFVSLRFPCQEAGLPEGCENMDILPSPDLIPQFFEASNMLQKPLEKWLGELASCPSCIISDICLPWTSDVALKFKIPRLVFHGISCFALLCSHNVSRSEVLERVTSDSESFLVPDMPDRIEFTKAQLPEPMKQSSDEWRRLIDQFIEAELSAQGIAVNTFEELEPRYVKEYQKVVKKIWCIGPLSLCNKAVSDNFDRGNKSCIGEPECLRWLDSMEPASVIYVCFGSLCNLTDSQLVELALGLEASNRPFIWVIREGDYSTELEKWLVEEKIEERIEGRGLIIRGWAPQVLILCHPGIGGFMTHCGWNSTLEGVSAGVPMITWPMFAEQFYNEKLIVQVLGIGVRVGVEACVHWGEEEDKGRVLVKREDVKKAIENLMDEGEEGKERRKRARALEGMAKRAVREGGSSYLNVTSLIQHIGEQVGMMSNW